MINDKLVIAFIPAKTGSVGLPGKLFKKIGKYSLLEWTLLAAYKSDYIDEIVVSSNDYMVEKITDDFLVTALHSGMDLNDKQIKFVQRPDSLCTPTSKTEDAISHFFETYRYSYFDYLIMLQATSPARRNGLIDKCFDKLIDTESDSILTVSNHTPFFWKAAQNQHSYLDKYNPYLPTYNIAARPMRQELSEKDMYYHDNGNVYITKVDKYLESNCRVSGKVEIYSTDKFESMQIDDMDDFVIMESLYNHYGSFL